MAAPEHAMKSHAEDPEGELIREREHAAQERAVELAQAKHALRLRDRLRTASDGSLRVVLGAENFEVAMPDSLPARAIGLALQRKETEREKTEAIAQEREQAAEQRVRQLAFANALLRQSAEGLGNSENVEDYLGRTLMSVAELLGAQSASSWIADFQARHEYLGHVIEEGRVVVGHESNHPLARSPIPFGIRSIFYTTSAKPHLIPIEGNPEMTPERIAYLLQVGARSLLGLPMVLNNVFLGAFSLRMTEADPHLDGETLELAQTLTNQAAIALHLKRVTDEAREAAIAREREAAALRQAEELKRANQALRGINARLATNSDLDSVMRHIVAEGARMTKADGILVMQYNAESEHMQGICGYLNGVAGDVFQNHPIAACCVEIPLLAGTLPGRNTGHQT